MKQANKAGVADASISLACSDMSSRSAGFHKETFRFGLMQWCESCSIANLKMDTSAFGIGPSRAEISIFVPTSKLELFWSKYFLFARSQPLSSFLNFL